MTVVRSNYEIRENELYETPEWCTEALIRQMGAFMKIECNVFWEPSAGNHKIANTLKSHGLEVATSDIANYDVEHDTILDFFDESDDEEGRMLADWIITNPPYGAGNRLAVKYAELALKRADNVALLLTAKFDFGSTRQHLFKNNPRFYGKIHLMDRLSFFDGKTGTEDHAWYVWTKDNNEFPRIMYERK